MDPPEEFTWRYVFCTGLHPAALAKTFSCAFRELDVIAIQLLGLLPPVLLVYFTSGDWEW